MNNPLQCETTACPLCGNDRSTPVMTAGDLLYGIAGEFTLVRCGVCEHVFLDPRPTRENIGRFYPSDYGPFRGGRSKADGMFHESPSRPPLDPRGWSWLRRIVLWWIDSRAILFRDVASTPKRALELGCSHGVFLEQLRQRGWECVGVEPAAEVASEAAARGFDVKVGSLEEAVAMDLDTFQDGRFDEVFAWMVIEHLHDPVSTLRLVRRLLKPGGWLIFSVPNFGCWERRAFGGFWYALQLPTHLQHYTQTSLRQLLSTAGFKSVELIHQRNVNNLVGTLGLWLRSTFPRWSLGERLIRWTDNPTVLGLCVLAPFARGLTALRQAGRLTVVARRP